MKYLILAAISFVVLLVGFLYFQNSGDNVALAQVDAEVADAPRISIPPPVIGAQKPLVIQRADGSEVILNIELAVTPPQQIKGLMFRESLGKDEGMLFVFDEESPQSFWMKNTLIPLDMVFIAADGEIKHIHENAVPHDLSGVPSIYPVLAVLEINGGAAKAKNINIGDHVDHRLLNK